MADNSDETSPVNNVAPILSPDQGAMVQHLQLLFGRSTDGKLEITGLGPDKRVRTKFFPVDQTDEAAEYAETLNRDPGCNVYVGAALRHDDVFPGHAADDADFLKTYAVWADADNEDEVASARACYRDKGVSPPLVVVTGRTPTKRAQFWWPLETPIDDLATLRGLLKGMSTALGTDPKVCTGKQLMRLAGSLAWPKKEGRVLERTELVFNDGAQREFLTEQIQRAFPPLLSTENSSISDITIAPAGSLGLTEKIMDGREGYAFRLVRATLRQFIGENGAEPSPDELYRIVAPVYLAKADQVRPGRGPEFLKQKCQEAVRAFHEGIIPGMASLDEAVIGWAQRRAQAVSGIDATDDGFEPLSAGFPLLSISQIKAIPDAEWMVEDIIPKNSFGFIYGAPGSYKSFLCYDLALTVAYGKKTWMDKPIRHSGYVLYVASEGASGVKNRITAWQMHHEIDHDNGLFRLLRSPLSFMRPDDIDNLELSVQGVVDQFGPVETIFVDTVSRVLPGADENLQKDMTVFVGACDRLRDRFGCTVIGVHHTNKNGDMRGSTVFLGQGDFVLRLDKEENFKGATITCEKQKEAEDGWKRLFEVETKTWMPVGRIKEVSSLVIKFVEDAPATAPGGLEWPLRPVCRQIQNLIQDAWNKGRPWSPHPRAATDGRYAVRNISAALDIPANVVCMVVDGWLTSQMIVVDVISGHSKVKGLKVEKWLD